MKTKPKNRVSEFGLMALVLIIAFLIVVGVSFAFKAALSFLEQNNLAKQELQLTELVSQK